MHRRLLVVLAGLWIAGGVQAAPRSTISTEEPYPHLARQLEASKGEQVRLSSNRYRSLDAVFEHSWDQEYLEVELRPNLTAENFAALVMIKGVSRQNGLAVLDFNLYPGATIHSVTVNGEEKTWTRATDPVTGDASLINVNVAGMNLDSCVSLLLFVDYSGEMNIGGGGLLFDHSTSLLHIQSEVLYTMAEPYDARYWLACYDLPGDKFDSTRVTVILPLERKVLSNGYLIADSVWFDGQDSLRTTTWFNPDPIAPYLINIATSNYLVHDAGTAGVNNTPIAFWVYPEWYYHDPLDPYTYTAEKAIYDFGRTGMMIEMLEHFFIPYPFNKYDQVMVPMSGAMEHQTSTSMSDGWVGDGHREAESVVVHELGHQWWGDFVGPQTFADIWLNEGFASYVEALWVEYQNPPSLGYAMIPFQTNAKYQDNGWAYPIHNPPEGQMFSTTVYDKGASILHMLRWTVGDSAFFAGMRYYAQNHAYGLATTAEFQSDMETISGQDLSPFFNEWVYGRGYPRYRLNNWWTQQEEDETWTVFVDVSQEQSSPWSLFSTPLPITVKHLYSITLDTTLAAQIDAVRRDTVSVAGVTFEPTRLLFNRNHWLMCSFTNELLSVEPNDDAGLPNQFQVSSNWPNPFNASTEFKVSLVRPGELRVRVVNLLGQEVAVLASGTYAPGSYRVVWNPHPGLSSGVYMLQVQSEDGNAVRRVILLR
ncbi:MAG: M1 family aminopeptidase [bacterium]